MNNHRTIEPIETPDKYYKNEKMKEITAKRISELVKFNKKFEKFIEKENKLDNRSNIKMLDYGYYG